jgi:NADP-dependent 3-hydroxy acid dehydrogenase YdfG
MQRAVVAHEGGAYDAARYLRPESVAAAVRSVVDTTPDAHVTEVVVRPAD